MSPIINIPNVKVGGIYTVIRSKTGVSVQARINYLYSIEWFGPSRTMGIGYTVQCSFQPPDPWFLSHLNPGHYVLSPPPTKKKLFWEDGKEYHFVRLTFSLCFPVKENESFLVLQKYKILWCRSLETSTFYWGPTRNSMQGRIYGIVRKKNDSVPRYF